ncbi:MAG: cytochrome c3 family protein [Thermodesulfobacteriota bacterium]
MRKRITLLSLPVLALIIFLGLYFFDFSAQSSSQGPIQPVRFSHKIHAGMDNDQLPCQYCHSYVEVSPNPGIPSLKKCMGCHTHIVGRDVDYDFDGTTINIKNEIAQVREYWAKKEPIAWNKVNSMPGYVHFTHKRHIQRGFECKTCHGDVANMNQVYQVNRLNMGFCIQCHTHNAKDQEELTHLKDCLTCHY